MHLHKGEGSTAKISSEAKGTATFMDSEKVLLCSSSKGEGALICSSSDDGQVLPCFSYEAGGVRSGSFSEAGEVLLRSSLVWTAPHGGKIHVGKTEVVTNELESCIFILFEEYIICCMMLPEAV